ncbi:MAG: HEAT repeat domain-containing protein [Acidobacteriota bacterium]
MNTRTLVTTLAIAIVAIPAAEAQETLVADRIAAAVREAARATAATGTHVERAIALMHGAREQPAQEWEAQAQAREQSAQEREAQAHAREQAAKEREAEAKAREQAARARDLYNAGKSALDRSQWDRAREYFVRVLAEKGDRADAAQYWIAYAQYKLGQAAAALDSLRALEGSYPESRWLKEAKALELQLRGASPSTVEATSDDELKLLALNSLIATDTEKVLPILEKLLTGPQSPQVKKRALFILSQSRSPKAREILVATARGSANPDLQLEALQYLGIFGGDDNFRLLEEIYAASSDRTIKRRILEAYMVSGRKQALLNAAKNEADADLRKRAVNMLGAGHATAELWELYQREKDADIRRATLEGLFVAGDVDRLIQVAKTEKDPALRKKAIQLMGMRRDARASALLVEIYWQPGQTPDVKKSVIDGLFIQNNATALIDIAKRETDASMKREAVSRLSVMKSKEATEFLLELINK